MRVFTKLPVIILFILAFAFSVDLFLFPGRSITFDAHVHITTIAQFTEALKDSEFPVRWADGFANYGHPLPIFAQQTTSYLGAFFQLFVGDPVLAYNLVVLVGAFASSYFFYRFLCLHLSEKAALLAAVLYAVAPYRIVNIYVRGALPEFLGSVFLPPLLIGIYQVLQQKKWTGLLLIALSVCLLALTHPMMLVISAVVAAPYALWLAWPFQRQWKAVMASGIAGLVGLGLSGYYLLPLLWEIRFTNYGLAASRLREGHFLTLIDLFAENWTYFGPNHPGPRGETLAPGMPEMLIFLVALIVSVVWWRNKKSDDMKIWVGIGIIALALLLPVSDVLYQYFSPLNNIQYPWRVLSSFLVIPPVLFGLLLDRSKQFLLGTIFIALILVWRVPQMYGKNYLEYDTSHYQFTEANLHTTNLNTVWMGDAREYPRQEQKLHIISGEGSLEVVFQKNASRSYKVIAETPLRLVEYTFYFPGWKVYIDGQEVPIQFQDMNYRGVITFEVPAGDHRVEVKFEDTKIRMLGSLVTLGSIGLLAIGLIFGHKYHWLLGKSR